MKSKYLRTSDLARAVGIHVNTVRLYEAWGFLPPVERSPSGYRRFTRAHLEQLRLARLALHGGWPGKAIRQSALALVEQAASGDLGGALEAAYRHLALVQAERAQAEAAVAFLERWAGGTAADAVGRPLRIGEAAKRLGSTIDAIRNWERNGLIAPGRDAQNNYRLYGPAEMGRLRVIRMLLLSGYSMMAILRMMTQLDRGQSDDLRRALDTPRADEDVYSAADNWLTTLGEQETRARQIVAQVEKMIAEKE